nr:isovaleryl-CoA dehydrogenase, mitochondrial-like [Tanacetum cinerariifolium]
MPRLVGGMRCMSLHHRREWLMLSSRALCYLTKHKYGLILRSDTMLSVQRRSSAICSREDRSSCKKIDKMDSFPQDVNLWKLMGDFNLPGLTAISEYGGLDVGYLYHCMAMEEISLASASVGARHGNAAQKEKYLPKLISGEHVGALSISEPGAGSDVVGMKSKADRVDGGFVINGNKMWCTNGAIADTLVAYAKNDVAAGSKGIITFIVEKGTPGMHVVFMLILEFD